MSTQLSRSLSFLVLVSSITGCHPPSGVCPEGFVADSLGRCVLGDAGPMFGEDGGPIFATDAGTDAAAADDTGTVPIDAGTPMEPPDAFVPPDACAWGTWYVDADHDGSGDPTMPVTGCIQPMGTASTPTDCDDADASVHPGATETCNGIDDDCNGMRDEGVIPTFFYDGDGDGYGDPTMPFSMSCTAPTHFVSSNSDCNDHDATLHVETTFYRDCDDDGFAPSGAVTTTSCGAPTTPPFGCGGLPSPSWISAAPATGTTDCADYVADAHPGATAFHTTYWSDGRQSFDWDCDGILTPDLTAAGPATCQWDASGGTCRPASVEWLDAVPTIGGILSCGNASPAFSCSGTFGACGATLVHRVMACR